MKSSFEFKTILLACLIISVGQLSMGLVFPSLPWIAKDFDVSLEQAQLLVSVYLLGFGPSQFLYGPISDALGRKKVLLTGLLIALMGLLVIIFLSYSFTNMVVGRFLQGLGTGCCAVLARATTRDRYSGSELPIAMSYIAMVASITPLIAPVIGGFINFHFGWSMVFISLLGYVSLVWFVIAFRFKETVSQFSKIPSPKRMILQYKELLSSRYFISFASIGWLNFSLMITTVSVMPFIMQNQIGMTSDQYAMWAVIPALGMLGGTSLCSRIRPILGSTKTLLITPVLHICAAVWLLPTILPLNEAKERFQRDYIHEVLALNNGNRTKTARDLGVDPRAAERRERRGVGAIGHQIDERWLGGVLRDEKERHRRDDRERSDPLPRGRRDLGRSDRDGS